MEETISLKEIFEVIKKRFLLILLLVVGAAAISAIISIFILTPTYESSTQFIVSQETNEENNNIELNDIRSNVEIINTYNDVITSNRILNQVIEEMNLTISPGALAEKLSVSSSENSQVVTLTVTDYDPQVATDIANSTVNIFQEELPGLMNVNNVNVLTEAEVGENPSPVSPNVMLNIAIAIVLGGMIGVGLAFLLEYLDNTVKTEQDVENKLGLPILGAVSHIEEKDVLMGQAANQNRQQKGGASHAQRKKTAQ
ncbi:YveK family protein [Gracilibacillus phocaeensis]|uniref:YveK family protein n=1 Tax=Gracilibacillus phocaeensis TaxID=2042304 RepID=UPI00102F4AD1|nr:Wzz/FepE/Etk N-terminal domain-containing protein [Gracilibacillus phocaeensis]